MGSMDCAPTNKETKMAAKPNRGKGVDPHGYRTSPGSVKKQLKEHLKGKIRLGPGSVHKVPTPPDGVDGRKIR
jgi:hypothetical protein